MRYLYDENGVPYAPDDAEGHIRGQELQQLRDIAAHTNRKKTSRTRDKREASKQEGRDNG